MRPRRLSAGGAAPAILLASTGDAFPVAAVERAAALSGTERRTVVVLSVARIWGTALGLPHPGLYPSRRELSQHREAVGTAGDLLRARGVPVVLHVVGARHAGRAIARWAVRAGCTAVVVVEPPRGRWELLLRSSHSADVARRTRVVVESVAAV